VEASEETRGQEKRQNSKEIEGSRREKLKNFPPSARKEFQELWVMERSKTPFSSEKENSTKNQNPGERGGGTRVRNNIPLLYYSSNFLMFILVYDCYIGRLISLLTSSKKTYFRFVYDHSRLLCR
jgi:hypothetical protein